MSEYPYGCAAARRTGRVGGMTTHRASKDSAEPAARPVERAVVAGLALAVGAGPAWIGGMIWTIAGWAG